MRGAVERPASALVVACFSPPPSQKRPHIKETSRFPAVPFILLGMSIDVQQNTPGHLSSPDKIVNLPRLVTAFYANHPDTEVPAQRVSFGTSGHRGSAFNTAFNEDHILAITQAICDYRHTQCTTRPALSRTGYARSLRARLHRRPRSPRRQLHIAVCIRSGPRLHPDARSLARHPDLQRR